MQKLFGTTQLACAITCALLTSSAIAAEPTAADKPVETKTESAPTKAGAAPKTDKTPVTAAQEENQKDVTDNTPAPKVIWKPGETLEITTDTKDIVATYDIDQARQQVAAYPDSPEAAFILATALTRTSRVEEALKEVQRSRKLAGAKGGPTYFDKMIASYENTLKSYPEDNKVRYGLAWAYYMKAYLLGEQSRKVAKWRAANPQLAAQMDAAQGTTNGAATTAGAASTANSASASNAAASSAAASAAASNKTSSKAIVKALQSGNATDALAALAGSASALASGNTGGLPTIPGALDNVSPADAPAIKGLYEKALNMINEILAREPNDVWSIIYGAHLRAEYTGDLESSMRIWRLEAQKNPTNPGPFFFLGEGYLKQGNLKESIQHVGKAISLRALGN